MAHEIETFDDGTAGFVSARKSAWHRLGTVLPDVFTAEDAMRAAFLGGWNVRKEPLTTTVVTDDGVSTLDVSDHYATVRTNPKTGAPDVLGVVGPQYVPVQNEAHCDLLDRLVDESGAHFETAGSLRGGRQVFVTMRLPQTMSVGGVDDVDLYIAGLNSHDGTSAFQLIVTPVRVVCANTQAMALREARASYSIRHTTGAAGRIEEARQALRLTWRYLEAFQTEADKMINESLTDAAFVEITRNLFPEPGPEATTRQTNRAAQTRQTLDYLWTSADTQQQIRGTRWAGYQAITEYLDHYSPVKAKGGDGAKADARALRTLTAGWIAEKKNAAYQLLKI